MERQGSEHDKVVNTGTRDVQPGKVTWPVTTPSTNGTQYQQSIAHNPAWAAGKSGDPTGTSASRQGENTMNHSAPETVPQTHTLSSSSAATRVSFEHHKKQPCPAADDKLVLNTATSTRGFPGPGSDGASKTGAAAAQMGHLQRPFATLVTHASATPGAQNQQHATRGPVQTPAQIGTAAQRAVVVPTPPPEPINRDICSGSCPERTRRRA